MEAPNIARILGGQKSLHIRVKTRMDLIRLSDHGVTKGALSNLARYLSFSTNQIAKLLPISERTVQRYTATRHFNRVVSEQILEIAEVIARGVEVFDDKDKFLLWINQPSTAFKNRTPWSLLSSKFGREMVLDELGRIEHGVIS